MNALRVALLFGRFDVDAFLDEIDADQFRQWCDFLAIEPQGWDAQKIVAGRLAWASIQPHAGKRKVRERDLQPRTAGEAVMSDEAEQLQFRMRARSGAIAKKLRDRKKKR